jgi:RimJ/RimL family protein N-acetyltransferase
VVAQSSSDRAGERASPSRELGNGKSSGLAVERLTHAEIPEICSLFKRVWDSFEPGLNSDLAKAWKPTPLEFTSWMERGTYFAAVREGHIIGAVGCETTDGNCRLIHLVVDPEARRQGVATALVRAAVDWARHSNSHEVWADVLARFTAASALLKHLEFEDAGVLHRHRYNEDVRFFEKVL